MTVVRKYATVDGNVGNWDTPHNMFGAADGACAEKWGALWQTYLCYLSGYGFAIPMGSTINSVKMGFKAAHSHANIYLTFYYSGAGGSTNITSAAAGFCADARWVEDDITFLGITVAELNGETFTTWVQVYCEIAGWPGFVDTAYIEVDYTVPVVSISRGASGNSCALTVLGLSSCFHRRRKRKFIATLK